MAWYGCNARKRNMQGNGDLETQTSSGLNGDESDALPNLSEAPRTRKITVQLSESMFERLDAATNRPGLGKSMVVETALERFFNPAPPAERLVEEALDRMIGQMTRLEHAIAIIAETVALHARYQLTVTPPMLQSHQGEACLLGERRFKILVEQVERRVRLRQPLIQETIDRLGRAGRAAHEAPSGTSKIGAEEQPDSKGLSTTAAEEISEPNAAAGEGGSTASFRNLPNSFC
ncbi:hypothetical protein ACE10Z_37050 [Bradyrhizobium sp. Pha-3]|uniref:hypothetical protein n=1 Tax=Bradyrhizobium sp. Pha-3 TaxID=208375 RepID=UPI0035D3DC18